MDLRGLIETSIAAFPNDVSADAVAKASCELGLSQSQFCDAYARAVADGYLAGRYSWTEGDAAMNALWGYISRSLMEHTPIPKYAFDVFLAFDAGETIHKESSDTRTTKLLISLHKNA